MIDNREYSDYKMILVDSNALEKIESDKVIELIDNGATLYIEKSNVSLKEISSVLGLDEPDDRFVSGAQVKGAFIFNQNDNYCFGVIGTIECSPVDWDNLGAEDTLDVPLHEPILIGEDGEQLEHASSANAKYGQIDTEDFVNAIDGFRRDFNKKACKEVESDLVYMQLPTKGFDGSPYYNYFSLTTSSGFAFGSATISQYRYNICTYMDGNKKKAVTDIVSTFTISPMSTLYVNDYKTRIHANISNMDIIGQSYLNSNSSFSYTLSGGFSANNIISGSAGASTTNSYSTNNQTIQNDFFAQKYKNWNSEPTQKWKGSSWEIEPCIRIINTDASTYKNQAYSSFRSGGWIGLLNVIGHTIPTVEVGGAWDAN